MITVREPLWLVLHVVHLWSEAPVQVTATAHLSSTRQAHRSKSAHRITDAPRTPVNRKLCVGENIRVHIVSLSTTVVEHAPVVYLVPVQVPHCSQTTVLPDFLG